MNRPFLSVVIPAYNEETRLESSLAKVASYLEGRQITFEVIVVNDGSTDGTAAVAEKASFSRDGAEVRVVSYPTNRGKGYAVRRGMLEARGRFALLTDTDLSTPLEEMSKLEPAIATEGAAIAFGSRDVAGSQVLIHQPWYRESAGKTFNRIVRLLTGLPFKDTQCGFKLFDMDRCRPIFERLRIDRFAFDVEILFIASRWGLPAREIPVVWRHAEGSKVSLFPDALVTGVDLLKMRIWNLQGAYRRG